MKLQAGVKPLPAGRKKLIDLTANRLNSHVVGRGKGRLAGGRPSHRSEQNGP
jgi:hypothetical protein